MQAFLLRWSFIMFLLSTTRLAKEFNQLCAHALPFDNELIKHKLREERDFMHENQT
jgi:hypothetical protein